MLYGTDEENRKSRVSALISNFELGKTDLIGQALSQQGLVFQRGERKSYHKSTGKRFGRCHPVFRAVPIEETNSKERIVHSEETVDWVNDGWHTVVFDTSKPRTNGSAASQEEDTVGTREIIAVDTEQHETAAQPITSPEIDAAPTIKDEELPSNGSRSVSEPEPRPAARPETKKAEPAWKVELKKEVAETIAQFERDGLMSAGKLGWKLVRLKGSSRALGTETMAERAISNRIISRMESSTDSELPVSKFICMALQNSHPDIFSNRSRRVQAMALVEKAVSQYFEEANKA